MQRPLWLIDLDNTLYDASWRVMGEINERMNRYVADRLALSDKEAAALRGRYWKRYGATLSGLVRHHQICPAEFLRETHPAENLADFIALIMGEGRRLKLLRGPRWLLTNSPRAYAAHMLRLIGLEHHFERIISIEDMRICGQFRPKPAPLVWRHIARLARRHPSRLVLIDDHSDNLKQAHRAGLQTARILVSKTMNARSRHSGRPLSVRRPSYVQLQVHSLELLARQQKRFLVS